MSLSAEEIRDVVAELQPFVGGTVQKIWAPTSRTVVMELRVPGATHQLLISAEADETRIHRTESRPSSPPAPLPIQNLLRAHVLPSRISSLEVVPGERIVNIGLVVPSGRRTLVAELTGRHGNLALLDGEGRVMGVAIPSPSSTRALLPGHPWVPPPPPPAREGKPRNRFASEATGVGFPLSHVIEAHYGPKARERVLAELKRDAHRGIAAARKRVQTALLKLEDEASRAAKAEDLRRYGDLLKTMMARVPKGAKAIVATEYTENGVEEVIVPLQPELSAKANLDRYYKQYRRMKVAQERIGSRREELATQAQRLQSLAERLQAADSEGVISEIAREAAQAGARPRRQGRKALEEARPPYRSFVSAAGRPIWVGRGAKENDLLTFRVARGHDLWFHARGLPGAHVVVPLARGAELDQETLLDACGLAAHYSSARGEAVAEIAWTSVRHVRKPKGSAPGAVLYIQEKVVPWRFEPERIERLMAQEGEGENRQPT